jgi:prepilin-type N-terminal cleavage/methylation domain-containing protein
MQLHQQRGAGLRKSSGMTLLELLVVVAILAVLATVAIQSTTEIGDQTRFDATQRTVSTFRGAVLGPEGQVAPDGSSILSGFLSDIGRLPRSTSITTPSGDSVAALPELYSETLPPGLKRYEVYNVNSGNTTAIYASGYISTNNSQVFSSAGDIIRVPAGWRGPYIRKPSSMFTMVDGWEKPIVSRWELGTNIFDLSIWPSALLEFRTDPAAFGYGADQIYTPVLTAGREVAGIFTTSGFEGSPAGGGVYSGQFESLVSLNEIRNDIIVQITAPAGKYSTTNSFPLLLMAYGPNPNVVADTRPVQVYAQQTVFAASQTQFTLAGTVAPTVGVRVFRAVLRTGSTTSVRSPAIVVPITRYTQSINIPLP